MKKLLAGLLMVVTLFATSAMTATPAQAAPRCGVYVGARGCGGPGCSAYFGYNHYRGWRGHGERFGHRGRR